MVQPKYTDKFGDGFETWNRYDVRDEWIPVIDEALDRIFAIDPNTVIHQIKEKFGGLRIYVNTDQREDVQAIIYATEEAVANL